MSTAIPVKSTQIVAGVAVVMALLGGAYAVGRSAGVSTPAEPEAPVAAQTAPEHAAPQRVASAEPTRPAPVAEREAQPALCQSCGRVTEVHTETRHGKASGVGAVGGAVVGGLLEAHDAVDEPGEADEERDVSNVDAKHDIVRHVGEHRGREHVRRHSNFCNVGIRVVSRVVDDG